MGKKKAAAASVDELVANALRAVATADGPVRLTGKGDPPPLFASAAGANKDAIARLTDPDAPLLRVTGTGKAAAVELTAAGFAAALPHVPPEHVGRLAKGVAAGLPPAERAAFLNEIIGRTPQATPELLPEAEAAVAAERAEAEARVARAAKERAAADATRRAVERWLELQEQLRRQRVDALRRELEALGSPAPDVPPPPPRPADPPAPPPRPADRADIGFRREVAGRLVSAWLEAVRLNRPEGRLFLETAMGNVAAFRQIGEEGQRVPFDGQYHQADTGVPTGTPVRVVRPGWVLEEEGGEYRLVPAHVAP